MCEPDLAGMLEEMGRKVGISFCGEEKIAAYEQAARSVGLTPVRLMPSASPQVAELDGLMLTGGTDINPQLYGQDADPETSSPDDDRDAMELSLLREALRNDLPVLAICRGMQLLNVAQGGTLHQHLSSVSMHEQRQPCQLPGQHRAVHDIVVTQNSKLASIIGTGTHEVNSRHHQAIDHLGEGLDITAVSPDGVVEAVEVPGKRFAVAVQWHPEDRIAVSEEDRRLFESFAEAVREPQGRENGLRARTMQ